MTLQQVGSKCALLSIGRATALSVSLFALTGCVSAIAESDGMDAQEIHGAASQTVPVENESGTPDGGIAALGDDGTPPLQAEDVPATGPDTALQQGLTMQSTALRAASSSIYGQSAATAPVPADQGAPAPRPAINATTNSLFGAGQPAAQPAILPQEGASNEPPATAPTAAETVAASAAAAEDDLPATVPLPLSAGAALAGEVSAPLHPVEVASADQVLLPGTPAVQANDFGKSERGTEGTSKAWTFASLFAPKRKEKPRNGGTRNAQAPEKKTITANNAPEPQVASLAYNSLPGVNVKPLFSMEHAEHVAEEDEPVEVANLSGLARLAPSGLILQTEKVETGCFKPELLQLLKMVEQRYGQRVMVTSGLRPIKVNRERQSLHTRCEAADIQVKGVSKWELADYLRSLPGRGGVGTYCHTKSVHIDIGPQRDWNWRCRRRKG
ncbi:hypothetical protein SJ05684_c14140 [Sinorhizobium sojae CCBAU 05684]|uniref:Peptidase M15A C-terminal domain-containing protein n=2 Tax=Sinorhizobium sojae TaxID=716925 RepID=A0A249PB21_9HYPH|nr:YcbK family protein [Sinorhizobium sojae]ASY62864.1 hypothetical protein SJ05684_c14140 [Sinorhizobium sojae CCBAU 05684]